MHAELGIGAQGGRSWPFQDSRKAISFQIAVSETVYITGIGLVCPLGIGAEDVWASVEARRSGIRAIDDLAQAGWIAPFGGVVDDFEPKAFVKPRKSLKVMAEEIQHAFAAGEQAWTAAGLDDAEVDPERMGVVTGAGLMYCKMDELVSPYGVCLDEAGQFQFDMWGQAGMRELFPLWMLKYLPNMSACHIGIRRDARGPTNTMAHGDASSLLALGEASDVIRRGQADVMITGGSSNRMHMTDPLWHAGAPFWQSGEDPTTACRPFAADRIAPTCGQGSAILVLESETHASRRGAKPLAEVLSVASRTEQALDGQADREGAFQGGSIAAAVSAALEDAELAASDLGSINAHGLGSQREDILEAVALEQTIGATPVTAPKSFFGNLGAAGGALELAISLLGLQRGMIPPTINHTTTDQACPVNVVTQMTPAEKSTVLALNYNTTGQAVAAVVRGLQA